MESLFCCPVCGGALVHETERYLCQNGHSLTVTRQFRVHVMERL